MKNIQPLHLILGGCGLGILGVFLPWYSFKSVFISGSTLGIEFGLGVLALLLLGGAIASCYVKVPGKTKLIATAAIAATGLTALLTLIQWIRLPSVAGEGASAGAGFGIYITILGALAGGYGCFLRWQPIPADPPPAAGPPAPPPPQPPAQPPGPPPA